MAPSSSNSVLASIFILSMLMMFLVPYTLYLLFSSRGEKKAPVRRVADTQSQWGRAAAAVQVSKQHGSSSKSRRFSAGNLLLVAGWVIAGLLLLHIRSAAEEVRPFDPFDILSVKPGATEKEIKRAYRQLSLKFHPDKNPDPAAATYFAEFISPAYKALTDETARANLEKHGHPDGAQGMSVGVALPAFLFEKGRAAPLVLALIVVVGILAPLAGVVHYILQQSKYTGNILQNTVAAFHFFTEQKNSLTSSKVLEILIFADEFMHMPVRRTDELPLQRLAMDLRLEVDTKDPKFQKLHPAAKKALLLLSAQMARQSGNIPAALQEDFMSIISQTPTLLEELLKITMRPRPPLGYVWLRPALSVLEYTQNLTQALPLANRVGSGSGEGVQSLLQLPHMDLNLVKKLNNRKIRSLSDLLLLDGTQQNEAVETLALDSTQRADFLEFLGAMPCVTVSATCETEGEEGSDVLEGDIATCNVHVSLERLRASAAMRTPFFPGTKDEGWWLMVADVSSNAILAVQKVQLKTKTGLTRFVAASKSAAQGAATGVGQAGAVMPEEGGQRVSLKFRAPPPGAYQLQVMCLSDYWIGCDAKLPLKLKVMKAKRPQKQDAAAERAEENDADGGSDGEGPEPAGAEEDELTESGTSESDNE